MKTIARLVLFAIRFVAVSVVILATVAGARPALAEADLATLQLREMLDPVRSKQDIVYSLRFGNLGDTAASQVKMLVPLPKEARFISVTPKASCSYDKDAHQIECLYEEIAARGKAGALQDIRFALQVDEPQQTAIRVEATVSSPDDVLAENNSQMEITTFDRGEKAGADTGIAALYSVNDTSLKPGEQTFRVVIKNFGAEVSAEKLLLVRLAPGLKYLSSTAAAGCEYTTDNHLLACKLGALEPASMGGEAISISIKTASDTDENKVLELSAKLIQSGQQQASEEPKTADSVKEITAPIVADINDRQSYNVTVGPRVPTPEMLSPDIAASAGVAATADLGDEEAPEAPIPDPGPDGAIAPASSGGGAGGSSSSGDGGALFNGVTADANNGATDFLIASFETDPDEIPAGSEFDLALRVENGGPDAAVSAVTLIQMPAGVDFVSVDEAGCTHYTGNSTIECDLGSLANGAVRTITARLRALVPGRDVRSFSASITSATPDSNSANNSQNVNATISNGADLTLAVVGAPNPAVAGGLVTYALTVNNIGLNIAEASGGQIRVSFNLPDGISYVSSGSGGNGWSCSASGQVVTCSTSNDLAANSGVTSFNIVGSIGVGSGTYTASGSVFSQTTPDVNGSNDTATYDVTVEPGTDLSVSKSVSADPVVGGSAPSFDITVTNNGPISASNLVLTDVLPSGFSYVSASGGGWSCSHASGTVTCTKATQAVGSSMVTVTVNAPDNADIPETGSTIINSASASSSTNDAISGNNTGSVSFGLRRDGADLAINAFSRGPAPVAQGSDITNQFTIRNNGPRAATGAVQAQFTMAAGETFVSSSGTGWGLTGQSGQVLTFQRAGGLAVNATTSALTVVTNAGTAGALSAQLCTSTQAGLEPPEGDPVDSNNCSSQGATSTSSIADLVVSKTASTARLNTTDDSFSYTLTVRNDGPDTAENISLTDVISAYRSAYDDRPATTVSAAASQGSCSGASTVSCSLGDLARDANATVTITLQRPMRDGTIGNTVSAYSTATGDNNRANNVASVNVDIDPVTDLKLRSVTVTPSPVKAGVEASFVMTFRNNGPSTARGVTLQSLFTGDYTFISATPSTGSCASFGSGAANRLDCTIGDMSFGNTQTVTVVVRPNHQDTPPTPWQVVNSTTVSTTTHETDLTNNAGGVTLPVTAALIDLDIAQTDVEDPVGFTPGVPADNRITYHVTVSNRGPSYATGVTFTDNFTPPSGAHRLQFVCDKAAAGDSCTQATAGQICTGQGTIAAGGSTESIDCSIGDMAVDASYERYLVYEVLDTPRAGGETHEKQATVSANEAEALASNNVAEEQTTVRIRTDVAVSCGTPPASVNLREPFSYNMVVSNNGPGDSQVTTVSPSLPTGMRLTGAPTTSNGGSCTGGSGSSSFSCDLGNLANGADNTITVPVRFTSYPSGGSYSTGATVSTNEIDTDSGNNSCSSANGAVVRSSLAGYVYEDHNDDGDMDGGETAIPGVSMRLAGTDNYGNTVSLTATTNSSGYYGFTNLSPSDGSGYTLTQTHPGGYVDGQENAGGSSVVGGSHATDVVAAISLGSNEHLTHYDFGELTADIEVVSKVPNPATVSLRQPFSYTIIVRSNGPVDATNVSLADSLPAGMQLTATPSATVGSCTGSSGASSFSCTLGTMAVSNQVTVTVPVMVVSGIGGKTNTATASTDLNEITTANNSASGAVTVVKSSINCDVYQDLDDDGVRDGGEPGISGVGMRLTGTDAYGNAVDLSTTTSASGTCLFDNLSPSDGSGYTLTQPTQPGAHLDGSENRAGSVLPGSDTTDVISGIVLAANENLPTNQFGELPPTGISGTVWHDDNNDGTIDAAEAERITGVTITLTGTDDQGSVSKTTTTDASGGYHFGDLRPGTYKLTQTQPTGWLPGLAVAGNGATTQGAADNGLASAAFGNEIDGIVLSANDSAAAYNFGELRPASLAGVVYNDTDGSGTRQTGEPGIAGVTVTLTCQDYRDRAVSETATTDATGAFSLSALMPSDSNGCTLTESHPAGYIDGADVAGTLGGTVANDVLSQIPVMSEDAGTDYLFGERSAGVSGYVYVDSDDDGVMDTGEAPISGVVIELTGTDADGAAVSRTATTAADGSYLFTGLKASDAQGYSLRESAQPVAWSDGKDSAGDAGGTAGNDEITGIQLASTAFGINYNFGELGGSLAGTVYSDLDDDGVQDDMEPGIPGATLTLSGTDVNGVAVALTTATADDGSYKFADLPAVDASGYRIAETQPTGTSDGKDALGSLGGVLANDDISAIPLTAGQHGVDYDFGETVSVPASIAGYVWHDGNHDRAINDNSPKEGWTVELVSRDTPSDCASAAVVVATATTDANGAYKLDGLSPGVYGIRFRSPVGGHIYSGAESNGVGDNLVCGIGSITLAAGDNVIDQNLPVDPSGVIYDALTRQPVAGATITLAGPAGFDPDTHLLGGAGNITQTTGSDGYYQFWLLSSAPTGDYTLSVGQPAGYLPENSAMMPVCDNTLNVSQLPNPALVQNSDVAPVSSVSAHDPASCPTTSAGLAAGANSTQYYLSFNLNPGLPSANVVNNHIPLDPVTEGAFTVTKATPKLHVSVGDLVPYTITARNNLSAALPNVELEDQLPPGFKFKLGSARIDGVAVRPMVSGRQLTWPSLSFSANQTRTLKLMLMVGTGVSEGDYVNKAWAENGTAQALISNVASAMVRVVPDPSFDCSGLIGKVFDDKNRNGYQDRGEPGLANVRLATVRGLLITTDQHGRYHVACADVPNMDRGSNFIMKLDERTLPSGYRLTTENPRLVRLTRGKIGKLNFGAAIHRVVRLDLTGAAFNERNNQLKRQWRSGVRRLVGILDKGPSVLRIAYARQPDEDRRSAHARIEAIREDVYRLWRRKRRQHLMIETEVYLTARGTYK